MNNNKRIWNKWVSILHSLGIHKITAFVLEAIRPLNAISVQVVYLSQPFLDIFFPDEYIDALADLLDDPVESKLFIDSLHQGF